MKDERKTKEELIKELTQLRRKIGWLENAAAYQQRVEETLARSEEFLKETGRMAKVGGWEVDAETMEVRWTDETYSIHEIPMGYKPPLDEAISFFHPEDRPKLKAGIQRALDHGEPYDMELRFITAKGNHLWTHTICKPQVVEGKTVKLMGTFQDITKIKLEEEEIRIRNEIAEIFSTTPDDYMYYEVMQVFLSAMKSEFGTFGYIDEKGSLVIPTMTRHVWNKCQVEEKDIVFPRQTWGQSSWVHCLKEKRSIVVNEPSTITPKGHIRITRHISQPIVHQGISIGLIQVANKETDYEQNDIRMIQTIADAVAPVLNARLQSDRATEQLKKHRDHLEELVEERTAELRDLNLFSNTILDTSLVGIVTYRADGQCASVNESAGPLIGATREQVLGQNFRALASWRESGLLASADRCLETGEPQRALASTRTSYGKDVILDTWFARFVMHGDPHLLLTFNDITDRVRAEESLRRYSAQLEAANKELSAFSYSVSHDLRAPLRAIEGFSRIVQEDFSDRLDSEGMRHLDIISTSARQMGTLIDDILAFSRLGRKEIRTTDIDMNDLARSVVKELESQAPERNLQFNLKDLAPAQGDLAMIRQALFNLVSNAVKFTRDGETAEIEVGSEERDNETVYYVKDNGVGFDMKYKDKLFGVFQRLHSSGEFEGTGVGLAIVQRIVHKHGGRVWAEAQAGEGATFYFTLGAR